MPSQAAAPWPLLLGRPPSALLLLLQPGLQGAGPVTDLPLIRPSRMRVLEVGLRQGPPGQLVRGLCFYILLFPWVVPLIISFDTAGLNAAGPGVSGRGSGQDPVPDAGQRVTLHRTLLHVLGLWQVVTEKSELLMHPTSFQVLQYRLICILLQVLESRGVDQGKILFLTLIAAPEGIHHMCSRFPRLKLITTEIDECVCPDTFHVMPGEPCGPCDMPLCR